METAAVTASRARVLHAFTPSTAAGAAAAEQRLLSVVAGEVVEVLDSTHVDWCLVRAQRGGSDESGMECSDGYVPQTYLQHLQPLGGADPGGATAAAAAAAAVHHSRTADSLSDRLSKPTVEPPGMYTGRATVAVIPSSSTGSAGAGSGATPGVDIAFEAWGAGGSGRSSLGTTGGMGALAQQGEGAARQHSLRAMGAGGAGSSTPRLQLLSAQAIAARRVVEEQEEWFASAAAAGARTGAAVVVSVGEREAECARLRQLIAAGAGGGGGGGGGAEAGWRLAGAAAGRGCRPLLRVPRWQARVLEPHANRGGDAPRPAPALDPQWLTRSCVG
jgi:hypothetical protein